MSTLFIIIVLNFVTFSIAFITATNKISDNRKNKLKWLNNRGWLVVICGVILIFLPALQYWLNLQADQKKEKYIQLEQNKKDSITNATNEANKNKIIITFTEALRKYGLKYDSSQKVIAKLVRDSANKITTIINANEPDLDFCPGKGIQLTNKANDTFNLKVNICSLVGTSYNINLSLKSLVKDLQGNYLVTKGDVKIGQPNFKVSADTEFGYPFSISYREPIESIFFMLLGTYSNSTNTKSYHIESISVYILSSNSYGIPVGTEYSRVKNLLNSK